jgi:5-methylcytosine-specific restriction endonuclease McrA
MKTMRPASSSSISNRKSTREIPGSKALKGIPGTRTLKGISDRELLSRIRKLSETERATVLSILAHLIEIDRRRLYLPRGYSSLFEFCVKHLGYSESTAGRRIAIARCIRDFPGVYRLLARGRTNFSNVAKISGIITPGNAERLLAGIEGRSSREVDLIVSRHKPKSSIRDRVRPVYVMTELQVPVDTSRVGTSIEAGNGKKSTPNVGSEKTPNSGEPATESRMVLEQRFKVEFGVDPEFIEKLERVRSLLSTKHHAKLEFEELFEVLMDEYIERHSPEGRIRRKTEREKRKSSAGQKDQRSSQKPTKPSQARHTLPKYPQKPSVPPQKREDSRYISRPVRDEVYARDKGRCTFVSPGGKRCCSKWDLQIDHIIPFARGGDNSTGNLRLLCAKHNRLEAKRAFGEKHMEQYCDT